MVIAPPDQLIECCECYHAMDDDDMISGSEVCPECGQSESFDTIYPEEGAHWANQLAAYYDKHPAKDPSFKVSV